MHPLDTNSGVFDVLSVSWNHPRPWSLFMVYDHPTNLLANRCGWFELPAGSWKSAEVGLKDPTPAGEVNVQKPTMQRCWKDACCDVQLPFAGHLW